MDAYLASGELRSASHFYLNFNFELLNGCKLKCPGCYVEKGAQAPFTDTDYKNFKNLLTSLTSSLYRPFIAFVGPTDFLSAENFVSTFSDPKVIEIFSYFKRLSLQTTYLDIKNAPVVAEILKKHFSHMEIEFNVVIDPARIMDDGYLKIIERNKNQFIEMTGFDDVRSFGIMNVYDYDETKIPELLRDYDFMHKRVGHLFETTIDYNFSFGRSPDISNDEFLTLSNRIKNLFDTSLAPEKISTEKAQYLRFSFGKLTDSLIERQYNYRNGKLYYSPLLYERFVSFRDQFEVPLKDYTVEEVESFEMMVQMNQYVQAPQTKECETCPFLASCIDRGILHLMGVFDTKDCLVAKNALMSVNSMLPRAEERV